MRLTKRQLKRIIREEYSRLKRRGLLREMGESDHEQDEFLGEQLAQYGDDLMRAAQECCMQGYMDQEDADSNSPEAYAANSVMMYGHDNSTAGSIMMTLSKCGAFREVIEMMKDEQESMFGVTAPEHMIFSMMEDFGLADEIIQACQSEITGNDTLNLF